MKKLSLLLLLFLFFIVSCKRNQPPLTEQEVIDIIKRFDDGWCSKNLTEVDSVLAPVYIYFTQSGGLFSREGVVQTAGSQEYRLEKMERSAISVELYQNTAIVSTRWKGKGVYRNVPFDEDQRCSMVVVKTNNKVEILSEHCTPVKSATIFH